MQVLRISLSFSHLLALFHLANLAIAETGPQAYTVQNPCASKLTCHDCIQTPACAWCYDPDFKGTRCFEMSFPVDPEKQCPEQFIHNPDNIMGIIHNYGLTSSRGHGSEGGISVSGYEFNLTSEQFGQIFSSGEGGSGGGAEAAAGITQIKPQRISLHLRARQTHSIQMFYTQAEDYPVDLYYLMDLSKSMEDDKESLSKLGDHLAETMHNITTNFTLGFGSFVDKVVMPYVSTIPDKLLHPCTGCVAPYGFRNHMRLSTNTNRFSHMVRDASVSGNLDAPEGGFDAIMQAVVCRGEIGWREKARRLLVFSTDAGFHYAGDGKLGGIVKPNDGRCHLDSRGYYSMSSKQDYPSISQINLQVKENAINVIFAVTEDKIKVYKQLKTHIEGASYATLSNDSSNIVELIKEQYQAISSTVEMKHNASSAVNVKFFTKCLDYNGALIETNKCSDIKVGSLVEFRIDLEVVKCPKDRKEWKQTIEIYPVGINESLTIDLEMLCDCPCEHKGNEHYVENALQCRFKGTYMCGVCKCDPGREGKFCECDNNKSTINEVTTNCISPYNNVVCSGRGSCLCGECICDIRKYPNETITGEFCECDNFNCERHLGVLCSGHGECVCGTCKCDEDWTNSNCGCTKKKDQCYPPDVDMNKFPACSGNGVCECGKCVCNTTEEGRYTGKFCEQCPNCPDLCEKYKECVQCQQYKTGPLNEKQCSECEITPIPAKVIEVNETRNEHFCHYYDDEDCRFAYVYYYTEKNTLEVRAQEERECPPKVFLLGIVLGVIAAVVLMGLAILLLWKLLTTIHDRREFAKFEKERMMAKWDTGENPIYKQATSTFKNPTYAGKG